MSDYICQELIVEIFSRLPPKSLLRFRSVSKSLRSCIDSPTFIRLQTLRSSTKVLIRHLFDQEDASFYTLHTKGQLPLCPQSGYSDTKPVKYPFSFSLINVGSCDGIFCLVDFKKCIYLWNPSIRRKLIVRDVPSWSLMDLYGFGFDPIADDYKFVKISYPLRGRCTSFVYAIKTGIWSEIASPTTEYSEEEARPCFFNGALHWMVKRYRVYDHMVLSYYNILTFDLSTHVLGEIALPKHYDWEFGQLTIIKGCLAAISSRHGRCLIWMMREYDNHDSWCVFFKLPMKNILGMDWKVFPFTAEDNDLLIFTTNDNDLLIKDYLREGITVYNLDTRVQLRLADLNASSTIINTEIFAESLGLLNIRTTYKENKLSYWKKIRNQMKRLIS